MLKPDTPPCSEKFSGAMQSALDVSTRDLRGAGGSRGGRYGGVGGDGGGGEGGGGAGGEYCQLARYRVKPCIEM